MPPSSAYPQPMAWAVSFAPPERDIEREILSEKKLSDTAKRLREAFARYACFANSIPTFRSREFVKIVKEAGLMSPTFNIRPPNRVDFVFTYACVHGPGGRKGKKDMSLEAFAYSTKGIAHETGRPHEEVLALLERAEPLLNPTEGPQLRVSDVAKELLVSKAAGEEEFLKGRQGTSPLVQGGVLATYSSYLSKRDAEQAALSAQSHLGPPSRTPRVKGTPEWGAYDSPDRRRIARRLVWAANGLQGAPVPQAQLPIEVAAAPVLE